MKKLLLLFIAVLALSCSGDDATPTNPETTDPDPETPDPIEQCENVYVGDVALSTQEEVDAFAAYNYCGIKGDLRIGLESLASGSSNIVDLAGLENLKSIEGRLFLVKNHQLLNLQGLNNIESVHALLILDNDKLSNLNGLNSLNTISHGSWLGSISIKDNQLLLTLDGIGPVKEVEHLGVEANPELLSVEALNNLHTVNNIGFSLNGKLANLKGLENVTEVNSLRIIFSSIVTLEGLQNIHSISESLILRSNPFLESIGHLSGVTTFLDSKFSLPRIEVSYNFKLTSLDGLQNLNYLKGSILVQNNILLKDFCAITDVIATSGNSLNLQLSSNLYNPSKSQILAGDCSLD